jgi:hypothetical protein
VVRNRVPINRTSHRHIEEKVSRSCIVVGRERVGVAPEKHHTKKSDHHKNEKVSCSESDIS